MMTDSQGDAVAGPSGQAHVERWSVGVIDRSHRHGGAQVVLHADQLGGGPAVQVPLHEAFRSDLPRAHEVTVEVPTYRGKSILSLLGALVASRLTDRDATVTWLVDRQQGPKTMARLLESQGWAFLERRKDGDGVALVTARTSEAESLRPRPRSFSAEVAGHELEFAADYGAFSPARIDDGTRLLLDVALQQEPVDLVADVGIGYGALAVPLVACGWATRAVGTDVDGVALWLAEQNAARNGVSCQVELTADPRDVEATAVTLCNVPTHIDVRQSDDLLQGLVARTLGGATLLSVVHKSLEDRYTRRLAATGRRVSRTYGDSHVVLGLSSRE